MTYFGFLLIFLVIPILGLLATQIRNGKLRGPVRLAVAAQVALALIYTTPWDNHLVATRVWYYDPKQVIGVVLGYVPLEEYGFFVLETLLVGLWWRFCSVRFPPSGTMRPSATLRRWAAGAVAALWAALAMISWSGWRPGTYLLLILVWALLPIILQLANGADILWHERRMVAFTIIPLGVYLSAADVLALRAGIWAIDPAQSTGLFIGGLPIEEAVFFFITVMLITFGLTLTLSEENRKRLPLLARNGKQVGIGE